MSELSIGDRIRKRMNINRLSRMHAHYLAIKSDLAPKTEKDKKEAEFFTTKFEYYNKKTKNLAQIRLIFYALLYATLIVNFLKLIPLLSFLVGFIQFGNALFGTTLAFLLVMWFTVKINLNLELMNEALTHLIALYHKNPKRNTARVLQQVNKTF